MAKTQKQYIDQQLNDGARQLDLRVYHQYKAKQLTGWDYDDDGRNLWVCHGKKGGGRYQSKDDNGDQLSLDHVLNWVKDFLANHPTETILLDLRPETADGSEAKTIYERTRKILESSTLQINPSTNEPYLYKEPGQDDFFAPYTHIPKLADCRGKIVLMPDNYDYIGFVGGFERGSLVDTSIDPLDFKNTASMMIDQVNKEYSKVNFNGDIKLASDATDASHGSGDRLWYWELNCTGEHAGLSYYVSGDPPHKLATKVNSALVGEGKVFGTHRSGWYFGWVRMDNFIAEYSEQIWKSNFFNGLQYKTVTVKSGLDDPDYPDQTYKVLKGTKLSIPANIYKGLGAGHYLKSWKAEMAGNETEVNPKGTFAVDEDVIFTAQWLEAGNVPVEIVWKDGDDADKLRPESVNLTAWVNGERSDMKLSNDERWRGVIERVADGQVTLALDSDLVKTSASNPLGQDTDGQYRYETSFDEGNGYIITLTHTPNRTESISGAVDWDDDDNAAGKRPESVTVRLFENGQEIESTTASEANGWHYDFGNLPLYEDGELLSYSITEDAVENYRTSIDGRSITNTVTEDEVVRISVVGAVNWDDLDDAKGLRPGRFR